MDEQSVAPALSTPDNHILEQQPDVRPSDTRSQLSVVQLHVTYEIERTISEIRKRRYKRVALQFPDGMLGDAPRVFRALESGLKTQPSITKCATPVSGNPLLADELLDVRLFILGDTSYGACCVDEVAAEHADADVVVHYGRSCLSPTSRIPAFYVFTQRSLDEQRLLRHFETFFEDRQQKIILMADVMYQDHLQSLLDALKDIGYNNIYMTNVLHDPSSPLPNRTVPEVVQEDSSKLKDWQLFHISDPPAALLLIMSSRVGDIQIYTTPETLIGPAYNIIEASATRALSRRYALLTSVSTVSIFGILINTLSVKNYLHVVEHVKAQIMAAAKKSYTFVVGKVNAAKIANFSEIGAWVVIGCWESSLIDSKDFWKPVITPFELELALTSDNERVWTGEWSSDFQKVLDETIASKEVKSKQLASNADNEDGIPTDTEDADGGEPDSEPESAPPEFDLRSSRYVSQSRPMQAAVEEARAKKFASGDGSSTQSLARRVKGDVAVVGGEASPGAEYLRSKRTWKGLGSDFEIAYDEGGGAIEEGRSGIARGYTHGEDNTKS